jgi:hypothetical protein
VHSSAPTGPKTLNSPALGSKVCPYVSWHHKDALARIGKGSRRGLAISSDGQRYRSGLAGAGTDTRPGLQRAATLAAKFLGFETRQELHTMQSRADGASRFPRMMEQYRSRARSSWIPRLRAREPARMGATIPPHVLFYLRVLPPVGHQDRQLGNLQSLLARSSWFWLDPHRYRQQRDNRRQALRSLCA